MDTRFSSAIHTLILISEAETPMTSEEIAISVGTNASYIRKLTGMLKRQDIIDSRQGAKGFRLKVAPQKLSLYRIYQAVSDAEQVHIFDLHQNPNDSCIVGRHIRPVLSEIFFGLEKEIEEELGAQTLADCIDRMRKEIPFGYGK
ncbi:MAG: Rrf2 family transcriptional regulator [Lachnospiraceae bacterium]|nr:Rrf2 family transcriptional regulator [Lachnospiraceae bacterium]